MEICRQMHGQANGLGLGGEGAFDGLLIPPGTVSRELPPLPGSKLSTAFMSPMCLSLIKSSRGRAKFFVVMGDLHDEAEVGPDHESRGFLIAFLDARGKVDLFLRREEFHLANLAEVKFDRGIAVVGSALMFFGSGRGREALCDVWFREVNLSRAPGFRNGLRARAGFFWRWFFMHAARSWDDGNDAASG